MLRRSNILIGLDGTVTWNPWEQFLLSPNIIPPAQLHLLKGRFLLIVSAPSWKVNGNEVTLTARSPGDLQVLASSIRI